MRSPLESAVLSQSAPRSPDLSHPWIRALDVFQIPVLYYASDARCCHASTAATELLRRSSRAGQTIERLAERAVAREIEGVSHRLQIGQFTLARETLAPLGLSLGIHIAHPPIGNIAALVIIRPKPSPTAARKSPAGLTMREVEVARLIAAGLSTKEIANSLGISCHTARHHTERVFAKMGVRTRASVAALFVSCMGDSSHGRHDDSDEL